LKGAIVFLVIFFILVFVTLGNVELPPGRMIYNLLSFPETDYPVLGIGATTLAISVFNGVVYGFVAWLIYTLVAGGRKKNQTNVNVTVNVPDRGKEEPKTTMIS
jgi:hypothetical protein